MKIIIDVMGADNPANIIEGAALSNAEDNTIVLVGNEEIINAELSKHKTKNNFLVVATTEEISNNESPVSAIRTKKDSSMRRAFEMLKNDEECIGLISAGSTGAVLTAGSIVLGRIYGIDRPTLVPLLPTLKDTVVAIADAGANMDCMADWLLKFAIMANAYVKATTSIESPKIGLLNVGVEDHKGNNLTRETFNLLSESNLNFVGNLEARDALTGDYDIIITDGFSGNVLVKSMEGTAKMVTTRLKQNIKSSKSAMFGALFMKKALKKLKAAMDYNAVGGAPLLGVKKPVVKVHGSSSFTAVIGAVEQIKAMYNANVIKTIEESVNDSSQN